MSDFTARSTEGPGPLGTESADSMLVTLAEQAASCSPASCGAAATLTIDGTTIGGAIDGTVHGSAGSPSPEQFPAAVTHPDLVPLVSVQWETGEGPIPASVSSGEAAGSDDLLAEERWPAYRAAALDAAVRSCTTWPFRHDSVTVTITLCGFRPGPLGGSVQQAAALIGDLGTRSVAYGHLYEQAMTEVDQLGAAIRARPLVDQASGILMHQLGCDAETAFQVLRRHSQHTNTKLANVAHEVVSTRGRGMGGSLS